MHRARNPELGARLDQDQIRGRDHCDINRGQRARLRNIEAKGAGETRNVHVHQRVAKGGADAGEHPDRSVAEPPQWRMRRRERAARSLVTPGCEPVSPPPWKCDRCHNTLGHRRAGVSASTIRRRRSPPMRCATTTRRAADLVRDASPDRRHLRRDGKAYTQASGRRADARGVDHHARLPDQRSSAAVRASRKARRLRLRRYPDSGLNFR